jgi:hypothetical protein
MKPTLATIERRLSAIERTTGAAGDDVVVVRFVEDGAPEPDYYIEPERPNRKGRVFLLQTPIYIHSDGTHSERAPDDPKTEAKT